MLRRTAGLFVLLAATASGAPRAELKLHGLFSDGMVLQRDVPCPVWGKAAPGEQVTVEIAGRTKTAKAGADGRWSVKLDPLAAGGPHELRVNAHTVRDVLVGEVWLAAGGSNMEMPLKAALTAKTEPDDGPVAMLRVFRVPRREDEAPQTDVEGTWVSNRSEKAADVSALAYFFGREIQRRLKVPVGVIQASAENSVADMWISKPTMQANPELRQFTIPHMINQNNFRIANAHYLASVRKAEEAKKRGDPVPAVLPKPASPMQFSELYNGMIAPLIPYGLKGAIWYQGEPEYYYALSYRNLLTALIQNWRRDWGQGDFPFGFVQLSNLGARTEEPEETALPRFRDAQSQVLGLAQTGMAVTVDIGDPANDRPRNKEEVGRRLALWAEARAYGRSDLVYSGPVYEAMKIENNKVRILFKNVGSGLKSGGDRLTGFTMASDFRKFVWANARIEGNTVVVWSDDVKWPAAVRYAWADNPDCNLFNNEGLPASPFRTDKW